MESGAAMQLSGRVRRSAPASVTSPKGQYRYHVQPTCLRAQPGDNIEPVRDSPFGPTYREKASGWKHSPILGWELDGIQSMDLTDTAIPRIRTALSSRSLPV